MNNTALMYSLATVICWGVYGVILHMGSAGMGKGDLVGGRMKAFLLVGVAYFLVAIVGPVIIMKLRGTAWTFPTAGWTWSLVAGLMGAFGAFFLLMALSSGATPAESKILPLLVPAIVFAGAPVVNAVLATTKDGNWPHAGWKFFLGIFLTMIGTILVMKFKPTPPAPAAAPATEMKKS